MQAFQTLTGSVHLSWLHCTSFRTEKSFRNAQPIQACNFLCVKFTDILEPQMKTLPPLCHQQSPHKSYKREPMEVTAWWIADSDETATANTERVGMLKGNPAAVTPLRNEGSPMKATVRVNRNIAESCVVAASFYVSPRRNAMLPADGLTPMNFGFALVPWM